MAAWFFINPMQYDMEMQECAIIESDAFQDLVIAEAPRIDAYLPDYEIVEQVSQRKDNFTIEIVHSALVNTVHRARLSIFALAPTSLLEKVLEIVGIRHVRLHGMARILDEALANFSKDVSRLCSFEVHGHGSSSALRRLLEEELKKSTRLQDSIIKAKRDISRVDEAFKLDIKHKLKASLLSPSKEVPYLEISRSLCKFGERLQTISDRSRNTLQIACSEIKETEIWQEAVRQDGIVSTLYEQAKAIRPEAFHATFLPLINQRSNMFLENNGATSVINFLEQWISSNATAGNATISDPR